MMAGIIPENKKRPRWLWLAGALFLCLVFILLLRNYTRETVDPLTVEERAWLKAHPVIRLAPDPHFLPFEYFDKNGVYNGITKDYVSLIEKKLGVRFKIVRLRDREEIINKAKSREIDIYLGTNTPQRSEYMLFTKPFLEFPAVIITRKKVKDPLSLEKMNGMHVSVASEHAAHNFIAYNYPKSNLDLVPDVETGLRKVSFGLSDAYVENLATATYYIEKEGITNLRVAGESGYFCRTGFASRKDWPELNRILEKGLAAISADEENAIYEKWIPVGFRSFLASKEFQTAIFSAFGVAVLIILGIFAWNRTLAGQVRRRTEELEKELAERKQAEDALRESEEKFRVLAETSPVAIIVYQGEKQVYVNPAATRLIGYTEQDCLEMKFWEWAHEDFKEQVRYRGLARQWGKPAPPQYEFKCVTKSGEEKWVVVSAGQIEYKGAPAGIASIFDITERKRMEEELRHAREELEKRVEERTTELRDANEMLQREITMRERTENVNMARLRLLQFAGNHSLDELLQATLDEAEALTRSLIGFYHFLEADQKTLSLQNWSTRTKAEFCKAEWKWSHYDVSAVGVWADCIRERRPVVHNDYASLPHRRGMPPEHTQVVRELVVPVFRGDKIVAILGVGNKPLHYTSEDVEAVSLLADLAWEITESKRMEEELLLSHFCINKAAIGIFQISLDDGKILRVNDSARLSLGYSSDELCAMSVFDIDPSLTWEKFVDSKRLAGFSGSLTFETVYRRKDGTTFPVEITINNLEFHGKSTGFTFVRDITEQKRAIAELELTQFFVDKASVGIHRISEEGNIIFANEFTCRNLGYTRDDLCTMTVFDIDPTFNLEKFREHRKSTRAAGSRTFESINRRKDGSTFPVEITVSYLEYQGKEVNLSFAKDITERKEAEEALKHAKEEWEQTFASVPDLIAIIDTQHRVLRVNQAMANRLRLKPDECVGLHCYEAIHGLSEPPQFCPHSQTLRDCMEHVAEVHEERLGGDFLVSTIPLNDERGVMIGSVHIAYDITERKRAEEALRESESRVRRKLESILDPEGDTGKLDLADILDAPEIQALMDDLYRITGLKMSIIDLKGRVLADVGWQDICTKFHRNHPETLKKCLESDSDLTVGIPQGEFKTYRCKNNMWHLVTPIIVGGIHMGNLFMGQFFFENEGLDYDLFRSQARKYGFPEEEYIAALEAVPRHSEELVNLGKAVFLRLTDMFSKLSYANIKLAHSLAERDRLTETLRKANLVVENSPVVLFRCKAAPGWPVELVSKNVVQFGYTPEEFLSGDLTYSSIVYPQDLQRLIAETEEYTATGEGQLLQEYRIVTKGGNIRWIINETDCERNEEGEITHYEGVIIDVTERKQAEDSIRENRAKYQAIVDSFDGLIYICSQDYRIEFMNRKLIERTGRDAVGEYCYKVMHDRDSVCPWCVNDRVLSGETVHWDMFSPTDKRWYEVLNVPIHHADGSMSKHSMMFDINDRKLFAEELQRQKKLLGELNDTLEKRVEEEVAKNREKDFMLIQQNRQAALGEMLDHIAHQWKQPLNSVALIVQDMADTSSDGELADEDVQATTGKIMSLLEHMAQTIDVFRGFYRADKEMKVFSIKDSIDQALAFIAPALRFHSVAVELDVDPGLTAFGYSKEYAQVLLNILANARDVFSARETEKPRIIIKAFAENNKTIATITDNAGGIPETIIDKIFDLYFTTNETGGGTGIGLYMSKNIIEKNMGGTLSAVNTEEGAQFRIEVKLL